MEVQRDFSWKVFDAIRGSANTTSQTVLLLLLLLLLPPPPPPLKPLQDYFSDYPSIHSRSFHPIGAARQTCAIIADENTRAAQLHKIVCPTLVVHGREDSLTPLVHGLETACAVPNAQVIVVVVVVEVDVEVDVEVVTVVVVVTTIRIPTMRRRQHYPSARHLRRYGPRPACLSRPSSVQSHHQVRSLMGENNWGCM
jgi:hypothetical protein